MIASIGILPAQIQFLFYCAIIFFRLFAGKSGLPFCFQRKVDLFCCERSAIFLLQCSDTVFQPFFFLRKNLQHRPNLFYLLCQPAQQAFLFLRSCQTAHILRRLLLPRFSQQNSLPEISLLRHPDTRAFLFSLFGNMAENILHILPYFTVYGIIYRQPGKTKLSLLQRLYDAVRKLREFSLDSLQTRLCHHQRIQKSHIIQLGLQSGAFLRPQTFRKFHGLIKGNRHDPRLFQPLSGSDGHLSPLRFQLFPILNFPPPVL